MSGDFVSVVEAAYRLDLEDRAWLEGLAQAARPLLDRGLGVVAYGYDFGHEPGKIEPVANEGLPDASVEAGFRFHLARSREQRLRLYRSGPCVTAHEIYAEETSPDATAVSAISRWRVKDSLVIIANDPGDVGTTLVAPDVEIVRIEQRSRDLWSYVAAHIASGRRVRRKLPDGPSAFAHADAILDARGQVVHAVDSAKDKLQREALREAAAAIDAARGALRREEPEAALGLWRGLVRGTWTLIDQFDKDGRRFVIAVRNAPSGAARARATLTSLERSIVGLLSSGHSNKLVAYELGISPSTVTRVTQSACRKLGLRSRLDLVRFALDTPDDGPEDDDGPESGDVLR